MLLLWRISCIAVTSYFFQFDPGPTNYMPGPEPTAGPLLEHLVEKVADGATRLSFISWKATYM